MNSRLLLLAPLLVLACGAVALHVRQDAPSELEVERVTERLAVLRGDGTNTVVSATSAGVILVDPKPVRSAKAQEARLAALAPGSVVRYAIATHVRPGLPAALAAFPGAAVVAHDGVDRKLQQDGRGGATLAFDAGLTLRVGQETVSCRHKFSGASAGDCFVYFHDDQVLVLGDLAAHRTHPAIRLEDGGDLRAWIRVLKEVRKDFGAAPKLRVVPGRGPVGGIEIVERQLEYLQDLLDAMDDAHRHGLSLDEAIAAAEPLRAKYAEWAGGPITENLRAAYRDTAR
jgi:glyoxylase-like metal-dependent hydrolase (beta-lactamase superfamily II)